MKHRDATTYHAFANLHEPLPTGRYASAVTRNVVGSKPIEDVPRQPSGSPYHSDPVPAEPSLGVDIDAIDIGEPPSPSQPSPHAAAEGERSPAAPVSSPTSAARAPTIHKRRA
jgi:hypothetical protein